MKNQATEKIREFNRFYLPEFDLLGNNYLDSEYSAAEARVLYEIYTNCNCTAAQIVKAMHIDKSYLSRVIRSHEKKGYLYRTVSKDDGRAFELHLTEKGIEKVKNFINKSNEQVGSKLERLSDDECNELISAFDTIIRLLKVKTMKVVPYDKKYKADFISMNKHWISQMFQLEAEDIREIEDIEHIIDAGGNIFFALDNNDNPMACCMIGERDDGDWEIMKFAAKGMYTGTGAGNACLRACIDYAKNKGVKRIIIVSNRRCVQALHLYRKNGFVEMPVDKKKFPFERADIAFKLVFEN